MPEETTGDLFASVTHDGFTVESNTGSAEDIKANLESEPAPKDGTPEDAAEAKEKAEKKKRSEAASELGKAGGKAAAEARERAAEEPEAKPEPEKAEPEDRDRGSRFDAKARVLEATQRLAEEKRIRRDLEARLARLEAEVTKPKREAEPAPADQKPTPDNYSTYEEYVEALTDWKTEQKLQAKIQEAEQKARAKDGTERVVRKVEAFNRRIAEARAKDAAFQERIDPRISDLVPTFALPPGQPGSALNDVAQAIIESENSAQMLLHLSEHPEDMAGLLKSEDSFQLFRAFGALEAKVTGEKPAPAPAPEPAPQVSKAKPPISPVSTTPAASDEISDDMPFDEYVRVMNARDSRLRRGR